MDQISTVSSNLSITEQEEDDHVDETGRLRDSKIVHPASEIKEHEGKSIQIEEGDQSFEENCQQINSSMNAKSNDQTAKSLIQPVVDQVGNKVGQVSVDSGTACLDEFNPEESLNEVRITTETVVEDRSVDGKMKSMEQEEQTFKEERVDETQADRDKLIADIKYDEPQYDDKSHEFTVNKKKRKKYKRYEKIKVLHL